MVPYWWKTKDGDVECLAMYERHYPPKRYRHGRRVAQFVGPGESYVMRNDPSDPLVALFVWRKFVDDCIDERTGERQRGVNCAVFRNEGAARSSELIRQADAVADACWADRRHYTYVDPTRVRSANPGYCFLRAGWRRCGRTKGGLIVMERITEQPENANAGVTPVEGPQPESAPPSSSSSSVSLSERERQLDADSEAFLTGFGVSELGPMEPIARELLTRMRDQQRDEAESERETLIAERDEARSELRTAQIWRQLAEPVVARCETAEAEITRLSSQLAESHNKHARTITAHEIALAEKEILSSQIAGLRTALTDIVSLNARREDYDIGQAFRHAAAAFREAVKIARATLAASQERDTTTE